MDKTNQTSINRVLVVDDDELLLEEYVRCLGEDFEGNNTSDTMTGLEKVLFGEDTDERGAVKFEVHTCTQGELAVVAVAAALQRGLQFSIVFIDITMPPGMNGFEAAQRIRKLDPNVNIVIVSGSFSAETDNLGKRIPPADKVLFFKKWSGLANRPWSSRGFLLSPENVMRSS